MRNTSKKKTNDILKQGTILATAGILVRIIGLLYRIPVNKQLGDQGNGIYSAAFEVYNIALIVSSYGMPVAVSKMIAAKNVKGEYKSAYKIFIHALLISVCLGTVVSCALYFGADFIANVMGYEIQKSLHVLAPTVFLMSILGVLRGFFQGQNTMVPTAISQIFEQIANAMVSIIATHMFMTMYSSIGSGKYAYGAMGSTLGTLSGVIAALIIMLLFYIRNKKKFVKQRNEDIHKATHSCEIYHTLFITIVPIILSQTVYNISGVIDATLFGNMTKKHLCETMYGVGYAVATSNIKNAVQQTCESLYGVYSGQYKLLLNVPLGIATAMGSSIIPSVVASYNRNDMHNVRYKVKTVVKFNMLLAIPSAVGLMVLGKPVLYMLFNNQLSTYRSLAGNMFVWGAIALVFFALSTVTSGVLQAINQINLPLIHSAISLVIHIILVYVLLKYTNIGIYALIIGNVTFPLLVCILNWREVGKHLDYKQEVKTTFILPAVAAVFMGVVCKLVYNLTHICMNAFHVGSYTNNLICTILSVFFGVFVFFVSILILKSIIEEELSEMPMGHTLCLVAKKMKLL